MVALGAVAVYVIDKQHVFVPVVLLLAMGKELRVNECWATPLALVTGCRYIECSVASRGWGHSGFAMLAERIYRCSSSWPYMSDPPQTRGVNVASAATQVCPEVNADENTRSHQSARALKYIKAEHIRDML